MNEFLDKVPSFRLALPFVSGCLPSFISCRISSPCLYRCFFIERHLNNPIWFYWLKDLPPSTRITWPLIYPAEDTQERNSIALTTSQGSPIRFMGTFERTSAFLVSMVTHAVDASLFTGHNSWTNTIDSDKWRELLDECHGAHESPSFWNALHWMIGRWFVCMDVQQVNDVSSWFLQTWKGTLK